MQKRKLLTIEDLVTFCATNNFQHFSSAESGYDLRVLVPCENFEIDNNNEDPLTLYANIKLMHTGKNRNRSTLTEKAAKKCLSTIPYKPILAGFTDVNGERDFTYHEIEYNDDGSRTYIEKQVGCFTADKAYLQQDPENEERQYIYAKIAIPREYTDTADIIERKGGTKVSAELAINEISYSIDDGLLLEDVEVMGCTLLGVDPETGESVQEGMQGAYLQIEDFSEMNNSVLSNQNDFINKIADAIIFRLSDKAEFSAQNLKEGGKTELDKFNELLEKYEKTIEDITFDYENLTDEELEEAFAKAFDSNEDTEEETKEQEESPSEDGVGTEKFDGDEPSGDNESNDEPTGGDNDEPSGESEEDEHQSTSAIEDEDSTGTKIENSLNYSVTVDGVTKCFAVSLADKINAVTTLVNDTYSEIDNTWYYCDVYEDDGKYCVMHDFWADKHYKQEYSVKKDIYSLKGDRIPVYAQYLTETEIKQLEKMKADYSAIESELEDYKYNELHSKRESIISSNEYSMLKNDKDFKELKENMDNFSVEELSNKADLILAKFVKSHKNFSMNDSAEKGKSKVVFMSTGDGVTDEEKQPYGGLFKDFKNKKNK